MIKISKLSKAPIALKKSIIKHFSDFNNSKNLNDSLQSLKELTETNIKEIKSLISNSKRVHIFQIHSLTKFLFIGTRIQVLLYGVGSISYGLYAMYYKYFKQYYYRKTERARIMRIKILSSFILVLLSSIFGLTLTRLMGKRIVKSIYFLPAERQFEINYFSLLCFNKTVKAPLEAVKKLEKRRRFDSTIEYELLGIPKYQLMSTRGTGVWVNKNLMEILLNDMKKTNS